MPARTVNMCFLAEIMAFKDDSYVEPELEKVNACMFIAAARLACFVDVCLRFSEDCNRVQLKSWLVFECKKLVHFRFQRAAWRIKAVLEPDCFSTNSKLATQMVKKPANGSTAVQENGNGVEKENKVNLNSSVDSNGKVNDSLNSTSELSFSNNELFYLQDKMMVSSRLFYLDTRSQNDQPGVCF